MLLLITGYHKFRFSPQLDTVTRRVGDGTVSKLFCMTLSHLNKTESYTIISQTCLIRCLRVDTKLFVFFLPTLLCKPQLYFTLFLNNILEYVDIQVLQIFLYTLIPFIRVQSTVCNPILFSFLLLTCIIINIIICNFRCNFNRIQFSS